MTSDKKSAALLAEIFAKRGLKYIVISPGSRNAPIIISFVNNPNIQALSIIDERSAAFFALGMAQQTRHTVAIACTSGTAALNYAPAIAEAYYQKLPLLVLTADRPEELIDQGDGQTIRQKNIYKNFIKASYEIAENLDDEDDFIATQKLINKAIDQTMYPSYGPVHINLPFSEPIYQHVESHHWNIRSYYPGIKPEFLDENDLSFFGDKWNESSKKLLIAGMMEPNAALPGLLKKIIEDPSVVLLSETTSNLNHACDCPCIDKVISSIRPEEFEDFKPEILVTFGGHVVSRMVKDFLRNNKPLEHWYIDPVDYKMDTYQCLTSGVRTEPFIFFSQLQNVIKPKKSTYKQSWLKRGNEIELKHKEFIENAKYSDLKVFETILKSIPDGSHVQLGNSTPVRYAQLFNPQKNLTYHSNRGTSGIDGTVSTAAGACFASNKLTTLIVGDIGFLYDSNGLMNNYLSRKLRIIIINNSGGGIFRFISGPEETGHLQEFFEARHNWTAEHIAGTFNVAYLKARTLAELESALHLFYDPNHFEKPALLEIFTPNKKNGVILKEYFNYLKKSK
jgi:2-succinyl-5-enolpyruvyl-6-hydroxy-3-cyclohexene-1-carboxylate synthase